MNHEMPRVKLSDICRPTQWPTIPQSKMTEEGYPVFGANGRIGYYTEYNHEHPTVLITCRGATCGTINVCDPKSYVTGNAMALDELDPQSADGRFVAYALNWRGLRDAITGSAQPQITRTSLSGVEIPLPPLSEQKRIADILDKADAIRRKRQEAEVHATELFTAAFIDRFGDPVTNPKNWNRVPLPGLTKRITVGIVVKPASYYVSDGVPALRSLNVRTNRIVTENLVYFSKSDNENALAKTRIWKGDVLLVRSGQPGTAAVVPEQLDGVNAIDVLIVTPDLSQVTSQYLCYLFNSPAGKRLVLGEQRGQIQQHLNVGSLKKLDVPLPPIAEQRDFNKFLAKTASLSARLADTRSSADTLFNSLVQRAFKGEL